MTDIPEVCRINLELFIVQGRINRIAETWHANAEISSMSLTSVQSQRIQQIPSVTAKYKGPCLGYDRTCLPHTADIAGTWEQCADMRKLQRQEWASYVLSMSEETMMRHAWVQARMATVVRCTLTAPRVV